ncbi:MAG: hypothetical protein ACREFW_00230 [Rhizomicrobium sp.]
MNRLMIVAAAAMVAPMAGLAHAQTMSSQDLIAQAVSAAPEELRAGATVVNYAPNGDPVVLRQGTNGIVCTPNRSKTSYSVQCYAKVLRGQRDLQAKERAEGKDPKTVAADVKAAIESGKLPSTPLGTAMYSLSGKTQASARGMWVILVPGMTAQESGLPTKPTAAGTPWLMRAGTPAAHIHIPQAPAAG